MKALFTTGLFALICIAAVVSCTKSSGSATYSCTCTGKLTGLLDTSITIPYGTTYANQLTASIACQAQQTAYDKVDSSAKCHL